MEESQSENRWVAGQSFSHYEIVRQLGKGGMGEVYLARDQKLDRNVAIKVLNEQFSRDESNLHRFVQEAKAASSLNHPNILVIYEIGENEFGHYIVSEFIEGTTLRELQNAGPLGLNTVLDISIQIASGLSAAHGRHLIHRDIKPENVMIRPDGYAKILDFGLAKLVEPKNHSFAGTGDDVTLQNATAKGIILGTVNYMSPEQARGKKVNEQTDIFSLGTVIYEMVAGRTPFQADTISDTFASLIKTEPEPLSIFSPDVPPDLQRIVTKMLRKDRDERYQTAKDLLIDLRNLKRELESGKVSSLSDGRVFDQPTERFALAATTAETGVVLSKRNWFAAAILLGILGIGGVGLWLYANRESAYVQAPEVLRTMQITTWTGLDAFPSISPDGNTVAFSSDRSGTFEIYLKQLLAGSREVQLTGDGGQNFEPEFSPDGNFIAYHSKKRGGIWVVPISGGAPKQLTEFGSHPAWSPDGSSLVFQSLPVNDLGFNAHNAMPPSTLWLVPAKGGDPTQLTQPGDPPGGHGAPSFSADGKRIVFDTSDFMGSNVWSVSSAGGDPKKILDQARDAVYAADGQSVFLLGRGRELLQINLGKGGEAIGSPVRVFDSSGSVIRHISVDSKTRKIFYSALSTASNLCSTTLSRNSRDEPTDPILLTQNANIRTLAPSFSPDGKKIAYQTFGIGIVSSIWSMDSDGQNKTQLTTLESLGPWWFPDGKRVAYRSEREGKLALWSANIEGAVEKKIIDFEPGTSFVRISPDGKQVVYNSTRSKPANVWIASTDGGTPRQLTFDKESGGFPAWSPDGKWVGYQMARGEDNHVAIIPSDGGESIQLTNEKGQSWVYDWSSDGDKVIFAGQRDGIWNVYSVSRTTKEQKKLTNFTKLNSYVRYPAWSPLNDSIVYECAETTGNIWMIELK